MNARAEEGPDLHTLLTETPRLCPAVREAVLAGSDGLPVSVYSRDGNDESVDPEVLAVESVTVGERLAALSGAAGLGDIAEWSVTAESRVLVARRVPGSTLTLILTADPTDWHGRLRFAARVTAGRLAPLVAESEARR